MFAFRLLLVLILLLFGSESSSSSGSSSNYNYDLSGAALTRLYDSGVYKAEKMTRPLEGQSRSIGVLSHSGVRVTLADGSQWLVHKGNNFGISSQTVVTSARHMGSLWTVVQRKNFFGRKTVGDFVKAGGSNYNLLFDNCHQGANRMMRQ